MRILVTETIGASGLQLLQEHTDVDQRLKLSPAELLEIIGQYDGLVVRSSTQVTAELLQAGERLRVVGRAGTGVDNIDVDAATERGILVVNAPAGNSNAVAEHTIALILALARRLFPAVSALKAGRWEKSHLQGIEVRGKVLGLVGLGRIGRMVASKARALEMRVMAFDPYVAPGGAASLGVQLVSLEELLSTADFISIHTPLTPTTHWMIGAEQLALIKPEAFLINCARGGLIDERALCEALAAGKLAGAGLDVFEQEPVCDQDLVSLPNVIATPHVGASTAEAQENVSLDVARAIVDYAEGRFPETPVNVPYLAPQAAEYLLPYIDLADRMGSFFVQWRARISGPIELTYTGELCDYDTRVLTSAFLAGLLRPVTAEPVNVVNARHIAAQSGLEVSETCLARPDRHGSLISASMVNGDEPRDIAGSVINQEPHLTQLDGQSMTCVLQGHMLVDEHHDRPGIVGNLGQLLGARNVNISFAQLGRARRGGQAILILGLDEALPKAVLPEILNLPNIVRARAVALPLLPGFDER
jgi:D-3-phosphoglycerate dehydrogenase